MATMLEESVEQELRLRFVPREHAAAEASKEDEAVVEEDEAAVVEEEAQYEAAQDKPEATERKKKKKTFLSRCNTHAVVWILAAVFLTYYVNFFQVVHSLYHEGCVWLEYGGVLLSVTLAVMVHCVVYLEWCCGISDYDARYPLLVPLAIGSFLSGGLCLNVSLWAVWSYFTPVLTFTQFMGTVMLVSLFG
ncbi:transmembrane protein 128 isoform X2 [Dendrobates tinctorius]|uniref:transmembrane protein 128 isoform X2 n=1 Tax=Dendrobates tinctorius TaxID=92724 RepID=UPI003CC9D440